MVFSRLGNNLNLLGREPFSESIVCTDNTSALQMMRLTVYSQAKVVTGSSSKEHFLVDIILSAHRQCTVYNSQGMIFLMGFVEGSIPVYDLFINIVMETFSYHPGIKK